MRHFFITLILLPVCLTGITLDEMLTSGLNNAIQMREENVSYKNTKSQLRSSWWDVLPTATVNYGATDDVGDNAGFSLSKNVMLNEPTYWGLRQAYLDKKNADISLQETRKELAYSIFSGYCDVVLNAKEIEILHENKQIQKDILEQTELLFRLGKKADMEVKQAQINYVDAEISLKDAIAALATARENLFNLVGLEDDDSVLQDVQPEVMDTTFVYNQSLTLKMNEISIEKQRVNLWQERLAFLPSFNLSYSYSTNYNNRMDIDITDVTDYRDSHTFGLTVSYDLFNPLSHGEEYGRSVRTYRLGELKLDDARTKHQLEFTQKSRDFNTSMENLRLIKQKLDLALISLDYARKQYALGLLSNIDLNKTNVDYLNTRLQDVRQQYKCLKLKEEINLNVSGKILGKY